MSRGMPEENCARTSISIRKCLLMASVACLLIAGNAQSANTIIYAYDFAGRVTTVTYPDGSSVSYQYDAAGNRTQVTPSYPPPTVGNTSLSVAYNTSGTVALSPLGNYTSLAVAANPSHGSASISGTNATYTPTTGYYGADSFTYKATGPGGTSAAGTVSVTVGNPAAPTVSNKTLSVGYNTAGSVGLAPAGVYTSLAVVTNAAHGSASISGTTATYTPTSGYYGVDSFTYNATGPGGTSSTATVSVTVANPSAPTAGNTSMSVGYNTPASVGLVPGGVYTSLAVSTNPTHGSASISGTTATYTPTSGYYGADSFGYTVTGPGGTSAPGTVSVTVANPPAPTVAAKSLTVAYNTAGSVGLSPSGVYTSLAVATAPSHGSASISGTTATFTPTSGYYGADSFTYTATGPGGTSSPATVSVTVSNPPAPTVAAKSLTVAYNTAGSVALSPSGVYSSLAIAPPPSHGSASISGATATYTPTSGYSGSDSFTYTASGPGGTSSPAVVSVTVQPAPNHAPTCNSQTNTIGGLPAYATATVGVSSSQILALCTDADGDTMTVTTPANLPYTTTLAVGQTSVSIAFVVSDGKGGTGSGSVTYKRP